MKMSKRSAGTARGASRLMAVLALVIVLTQIAWPVAAQMPSPTRPVEAFSDPNLLAPTSQDTRLDTIVASSDLLFRSRIRVETTYQWQKLEALGITILERDAGKALILADFNQLETLARLGFEPASTDDLTVLTAAHAQAKPWLALALEPLLREAAAMDRSLNESIADADIIQELAPIRAAVAALTPERLAGIAALTSLDDDADGLTNTEEAWWCTDPWNSDSDGDGVIDGAEVAALQEWLSNQRAGPPSSGKPFSGWPPQTTSAGYPDRVFACQDDDLDAVPDLAERWILGLNMNRESTDRDKFDDGQELFGNTYCPGSGGFCGYGALPRDEDWGVIFAEMPAWVNAPGNHPNVAAFPVIEVNLVADAGGNTFRVETVTEVTTDHVIAEGTSESYATSKTEGTSDESSNGLTHNEWQEVSEAHAQVIRTTLSPVGLSPAAVAELPWPDNWIDSADQFIRGLGPVHDVLDLSDADPSIQEAIDNTASLIEGAVETGLPTARTALALPMAAWGGFNCLLSEVDATVSVGGLSVSLDKVAGMACKDYVELARQISPELAEFLPSPQAEDLIAQENVYATAGIRVSPPASPSPIIVNNSIDTRGITQGLEGMRLAYLETGELISDRLYEINQGMGNISHSLDDISSGIGDVSAGIGQIADILAAPVETSTNTDGHSVALSETTTHTTSEAHTITNDESFSSQESWGTATAINSAHAADLWFTYQVRNSGTEYAREIGDLAFNIYIGNDPVPAYTYFVAPDVGGDGKFHTFMPGEFHPYTAHIPLSLRQMTRIDLGGPVRIVVEDYTYGIDELFYQDAVHSGIVVGIDDSIADGDEEDDSYLFPTWGEDTVMDVLGRYFPTITDADGDLTALWTPETRTDTPEWCAEAYRTGQRLWCKHALSTANWWQVHLSAPGDTDSRYHDALAQPGLLVYLRFQSDSDLDGYSDRTELELGTPPHDAAIFPQSELVAGVHSVQSGNQVTATLSMLNTGLDDAKIIQAVMLAPDDSITIDDNTVGGSARVRSQQRVSVAGRVTLDKPIPASWTATEHAYPAIGGDFTGSEVITYTFTPQCAAPDGCDVGSGAWNLNWSDTSGGSGALSYGDGYHSPEYLAVGPLGVKLGLISGQVSQGDSFSAVGIPARDTFRYTINVEPPEAHTLPIVVVSYSDARGSHRFVIPPAAMELSNPSTDLSAYRGTMLAEPGVEILASNAITLGINTTPLVVYNPASSPLDGAHIYMEFLNMQGAVVHQAELTVDAPPGPTVLSFDWSTSAFTPAFTTDEDYMVMAFLADRQDTIIDTATQPLFFFYSDPPMKIAVPRPSADVGTIFHADSYAALATLLGASHAAGASQQSATYRLRGGTGQPTAGASMVSGNFRLTTGFLAAARPLLQGTTSVAARVAAAPDAATDVLFRFPTRCFPLVNTGRHPLKLRAISTDPALTVTQSAAAALESGQYTEICARLNTDGLPAGDFDKILPVYTSDPTHPMVELHLTGTVVAGGDVVFVHDYQDEVRPLNKILHVNSTRGVGEVVRFEHGVAGETATLHPLFVYGETDTGAPLGRGAALGGVSATQAAGDSAITALTLPEGTASRRDYIVQYGYQAELPTGGGQTVYQAPLAPQGYATVTLDIVTANLASQNVVLALDVGADGGAEWSFSGALNTTEDRLHAASGALTAAVNAYLNAHAGGLVPIRLTTDVGGTYFLANVRGTPSQDADLLFLGGLSISSTTPIETETVQLCATAANNGAGNVSAAVIDFIAGLPEVDANLLIDYGALAGLAAGGGQGSGCVDWDTTGQAGDVVLYGVVDFPDQVPETDETNNVISTTINVRSRPDLLVSSIELSDAEPVAGEAITVTLTLRNNGQTAAVTQTVALYNGNPDAGGTVVGSALTPSLAGGATTNLAFTWTPATPGLQHLTARADRDDQVNEFDEANNDRITPIYVGLAGPVLLDSGVLASDPPYTTTAGYGAVDEGQADVTVACGVSAAETLRRDPDGRVVYRFDHLLPGHFYHLDTTLYECDGAHRQETIGVDGNALVGPVDLSDAQPHRFSTRLDPALYADRTISVTVEAPGINGAVVSEVNLHDVDYRYADAGASSDLAYSTGRGYGWLNGVANSYWGPLPYQNVRVNQSGNELHYRFDKLAAARRYQVNLTLYQGDAVNVIEEVLVDGLATGVIANLSDRQPHYLTVDVPVEAYRGDSSIVVAVRRTNGATGAFANEIAIEEKTLLALPAISDLQVSNVTAEQATISWLTDAATDGAVHFGATTALGGIALDERGAPVSARTHQVTLLNLTAATTYHFYVISSDAIDDNGGAYYQFTTGPAFDPNAPDLAFGRVLKSDGSTLAAGALVRARLRDDDAQGTSGDSALRSALVDSSGYWSFDLAATRTPDHSQLFEYSLAGDDLILDVTDGAGCTASLTVDTGLDTPAPDIILVCPTQVTHSLASGWSLLGLNVMGDVAPTAEEALDDIVAQGGSAIEIERWWNGGWEAHVRNLPFNNFTLELGRGYFVRSSAASAWTRTGRPLVAPLTVHLYPGWNLIGLPKLTSTLFAEDLLTGIATQGGTCPEVDRWVSGGWVGHPKGYPVNNFAITTTEGYFVKCTQQSTYTPGATLLAGAGPAQPPATDDAAVQPAAAPAIHDVMVTNLRDVAFSVTWRTDQPSTGWISYRMAGEPEASAEDDRGAGIVSTLHQVTVVDLTPETAYTFRVHAGDSIAEHDGNGQPFQAVTPATTAPGVPLTAFGQVLTGAGQPVAGALVRAWLVDPDNTRSAPLSALVESGGYWALSLPAEACAEKRLALSAFGPDGAVAQGLSPACAEDVQPAPTLTLQPKARMPIYLPLVVR